MAEENPVQLSWIQRIATYAKKHLFVINFIVLNAVCLVSIGVYVHERPTKEIFMIYNAVFLGCALLSQFAKRGYFAKIPYEIRHYKAYRSGEASPENPSDEMTGTFEEVKNSTSSPSNPWDTSELSPSSPDSEVEATDESTLPPTSKPEAADESALPSTSKLKAADESALPSASKQETADESLKSQTPTSKSEAVGESTLPSTSKQEAADESAKPPASKPEATDQ